MSAFDPKRTLRLGCPLRYNAAMNGPGEWEAVHTVEEFWDQPRKGFADYRGHPHAYACEWDESADDWGSTYLLSAISDEQLAWAKEKWGIFERWRAAHDEGSLTEQDKHPALSADRPRYDELVPLVSEAFAFDKTHAVRATARFCGGFAPLNMKVCWHSG